MDHVLANVLHERVFAILSQLESASTPQATISLTSAWRTLLTLHEQTDTGACKACGPRWRKHMCSVWRVATAYFIRHDRDSSPP
ncbi:hypothetical protein ABZX92_30360 [Lentzea sp. NPDC006480]|uniref:hypothetical protein n=1 Tax=Lentzea sp. NPDC006480 TaxID=3157176 RepID=UPI0033A2CD53